MLMSKLIAAIRAEQPAVPIVVVTPTVSWREGLPCPGPAAVTPEQQREQIGAAVRARQQSDPNLFLISGLQIMPKEYAAVLTPPHTSSVASPSLHRHRHRLLTGTWATACTPPTWASTSSRSI